MANMEHISLTLFRDLQFLLLHPPLILRVLQLHPLLLLSVDLQQLPGHLVLLPVEARSIIFSSRASRL
jgi:hypothetical protein